MDWYFILFFIAIAAGVYTFINFREMRPPFRWLGFYLFAAGVFQIIAKMMIELYGISNTPLFNVVMFVYHFLLFMFFLKLSSRKRLAIFIKILFLISAVFMFYFIVNQVPENWLSLRAILVQHFVFSITAMLFLLNILRSNSPENPIKSSRFIALVGMLFYFSSSIVFFSAQHLSAGKVSFGLIKYFNIVLLYVFYIILVLALLVEKKQNRIHGIQR